MQNTKRKLANAQKRYAQAVAQTQQCKAAMLAGGSYAVYKLAIAEEDAALAKLNALQAQVQT
jgi:hypothetical protein